MRTSKGKTLAFQASRLGRSTDADSCDLRPHNSGNILTTLLTIGGIIAIAGIASAEPAPTSQPSSTDGPSRSGTRSDQSASATSIASAVNGEILVTARHRSEDAHSVPATIAVISGDFLEKTNTTNIGQLVTYLPSVQFAFSNPRNSSLDIRGLGNLTGVASDGTDPGVGFYVDQVYYSRPAMTTLDLVDIDHVEVFDGPQGTLFGKNTTAGLISVTTASPSFKPGLKAELSGGNEGYYVAKGSVTGPIIGDTLAGRLSMSTSNRDGNEANNYNGDRVNGYNNFNIRGQLLFTPTDNFKLRLISDFGRQNLDCCVNVLSAIVQPANGKNFVTSAEHFGYTPSVAPFSRHLDYNSDAFARQRTGGASLEADWETDHLTLTSISAGRFWNWRPANDVDATPLSVLSAASQDDYERQYSQEFRAASKGENVIDFVGGLYLFHETVTAQTVQRYGDAASYFLFGAAVPAAVLDGYGLNAQGSYNTWSYAAYGQATWHITSKLNVTGGVRYTRDHKTGSYDQTVPALPPLAAPLASLNALRSLIAFPVAYKAKLDEGAPSGRVDLSYAWTSDILTYATYAHGNRSGGINLSQPALGSTPTVAPETIDNAEMGAKLRFLDRRLTLNASAFYEWDHDYQGTVQVPGTTTQYLANIPKVISRGVELSAQADPSEALTLYASDVFDDAHYTNFPSSPCGLENVLLKSCSLTGRPLAGVPRWSVSTGGEYRQPVTLLNHAAVAYVAVDDSFRSAIYSAETDSIYTREPRLNLLNARLGIRSGNGEWNVYLWGKNVTNRKYFTSSSPGIGNTGAIFSTLGDPATYGITLALRL